eukprot:2572409-Rhodomonas_salina.1
MNVFDLVEVNTPARFEKALRKQTPEEVLDCGTIFFRGHDADTLEISDLPFPSYACADDLLAHLQTIPIFSLSHPHLSHALLSPPPPMDSLPSAPV